MTATGTDEPGSEPAFDHRDQGTGEEVWAAWDALDGLPRPAWLPGGLERLLVVAAHPDDECLGAGGLLVAAHEAGLEVEVLVATAGEASHPGSPTLGPTALSRRRVHELQAAVAELDADAVVTCLGLPDGGLEQHEDAVRAAVAARLAPGTLVAAPWVGDRHPDHEAAGRGAVAAAREAGAALLGYPVWAWHWARPGELDLAHAVRLDLTPSQREAKRRAVRRHRSQVLPLSPHPADQPVLTPAVLAHHDREFETFFLDDPAARVGAELDALHRRRHDPWSVHTSWYEQRKRSLLLAALPRARYESALEVGCSVGALTAELAVRCEHLVATDVSPAALAAARVHVGGEPGVELVEGRAPRDWPERRGGFDLVVLSEVGYFLGAADLTALAERTLASLRPGGHVVACHWRHPVVGWPLDGARVHELLAEVLGPQPVVDHAEEDFVLQVWALPGTDGRPPASPARTEGLV